MCKLTNNFNKTTINNNLWNQTKTDANAPEQATNKNKTTGTTTGGGFGEAFNQLDNVLGTKAEDKNISGAFAFAFAGNGKAMAAASANGKTEISEDGVNTKDKTDATNTKTPINAQETNNNADSLEKNKALGKKLMNIGRDLADDGIANKSAKKHGQKNGLNNPVAQNAGNGQKLGLNNPNAQGIKEGGNPVAQQGQGNQGQQAGPGLPPGVKGAII